MPIVPNILLRRVYRKNSLRKYEKGIAFDLRNILGPGIITKINFVKINDFTFEPDKISLISSEKSTDAKSITVDSPFFCTFGQNMTILLEGENVLVNGNNEIVIDIVSREAGNINVSVKDTLNLE